MSSRLRISSGGFVAGAVPLRFAVAGDKGGVVGTALCTVAAAISGLSGGLDEIGSGSRVCSVGFAVAACRTSVSTIPGPERDGSGGEVCATSEGCAGIRSGAATGAGGPAIADNGDVAVGESGAVEGGAAFGSAMPNVVCVGLESGTAEPSDDVWEVAGRGAPVIVVSGEISVGVVGRGKRPAPGWELSFAGLLGGEASEGNFRAGLMG